MSPKVVVGMMGSSVAGGADSLNSSAGASEFLTAVKAHGISELDTARVYNEGKSEELLGEIGAPKEFLVATKAPSFTPGSLASQKIIKNCGLSLKALKLEQIPLYYLHGWDTATPLQEQCGAIKQLLAEGKIDEWGISNISTEQVQEIFQICEKEGLKKPSVYQGGYNPVNRVLEENLFPLLRKHNVAFYAYSPLAGGLLAKSIDHIKKPTEGSRFAAMPVFAQMYANDHIFAALQDVTDKCKAAGITVLEATLRWFTHHSPLEKQDAVILGASSVAQIETSLAATEKGKLDDALVAAMENLWVEVKRGTDTREVSEKGLDKNTDDWNKTS